MEEDGEGDLSGMEGVIVVDGEQRLLNSSSHSTTPSGPTRCPRVRFLLTIRLSELSAIFGPFHLTSATATIVVSASSGHSSRSILRTTNHTSNFRDSNGAHGCHLMIRSSLFFHLSWFFFQKTKKALRPPLLPFLFFSILPSLLLPPPICSSLRRWHNRSNPTRCHPGTGGGCFPRHGPGEPSGPNQHVGAGLAPVLGEGLRRLSPLPPPPRHLYTLLPSPLPTTSGEASTPMEEGI